MIVGDVFKKQVEVFGDKKALICENENYTYQDLWGQSVSFANSLLNFGLRTGDTIGFLTRKTPETIIGYLGASLAGIVGVPLSFHYQAQQFAHLFSLTKMKIVIIDHSLLALKKVLLGITDKLTFVVVRGSASASDIGWEQFLASGGLVVPSVALREDDPFYLNLTSGSTGMPKAVAASHRQLAWNTRSSIEALTINVEDRHLCMFAVFSHPHEIFCRSLWTGGTMVLLDSLYPKSIASAITRHKVTCIMGLAPMYEMLIPFANSPRFDFSTVRLAESGGMRTSLSLQERFLKAVGTPIRPVWGSTETAGVALAVPEKVGPTLSCGKPAPHYHVKIVDKQGNEVEPGETGEMLVSGPAVAEEYFNDEKETERHFHQGWFHTGDMVYQDESGLIYFRGRGSGMMKVGGLKVFPKEIEEIIQNHPQVDEVAVVAVFEKLRGEVPCAVVSLSREGSLSTTDIKDHCRAGLPNYMIPKRVEFRTSLPRTPSGKIDYRRLKDELQAGLDPSEAQQIRDRIAKIDVKLVQLLNERAQLSLKLRDLNQEEELILFQPGKVESDLAHIVGHNSGPLHDEFLEDLFRQIFEYLTRL